MKSVLVSAGGFLGGLLSLLHVVHHLPAYHPNCSKAPISACLGTVVSHAVIPPLLYVAAWMFGGMLIGLLISLSLKAMVSLIAFR